jgi:hypothetical protein
LNLIAKSLLKHFELPEKKIDNLTDDEHQVLGDLVELAEDIDIEEVSMQKEREQSLEDKMDDNNLED